MRGFRRRKKAVIGLRPIGTVPAGILARLVAPIEKAFGRSVRIDDPLEAPDYAYDPIRGQYSAYAINDRVRDSRLPDEERTLGITTCDLFVPELSFVFGLANPPAGVAAISLARLDPAFYQDPPNDRLFEERAIKEALHELGHTFGLHHCPDPRCVMHFSNSIADTDIKEPQFCARCGLP